MIAPGLHQHLMLLERLESWSRKEDGCSEKMTAQELYLVYETRKYALKISVAGIISTLFDVSGKLSGTRS